MVLITLLNFSSMLFLFVTGSKVASCVFPAFSSVLFSVNTASAFLLDSDFFIFPVHSKTLLLIIKNIRRPIVRFLLSKCRRDSASYIRYIRSDFCPEFRREI